MRLWGMLGWLPRLLAIARVILEKPRMFVAWLIGLRLGAVVLGWWWSALGARGMLKLLRD